VRVPAITLSNLLDRNGWSRGRPVAYGQHCTSHLKYFPAIGRLAVLHYEPGVSVFGGRADVEGPAQTLRECFFVAELVEPAQGFQAGDAVPLGSIDPVVMCDVLAVLHQLASKAVQE
jgi:hypothetical protein